MSWTVSSCVGMLGAPSLVLAESAARGAAVLLVAAVAALALRRDSAATRHLVWRLAIVAMLAVPVLSALLPEWRVLPVWANMQPWTAAAASPAIGVGAPLAAPDAAENSKADAFESPPRSACQPDAAITDARPAAAAPEDVSASAVGAWIWAHALPLVWAIGFCLLVLRLTVARWMLWKIERQGTVIWPSRQAATDDPIAKALDAASSAVGSSRPARLLVHSGNTIPTVLGILRCRVLLPADARHWSREQLQSVLVHELAHITRRDTVAQLLTQVACALHWFNPLVWFAGWRLGVEAERACDDLVLASGVRPSAYAGHLLDVVTEASPVRWPQSCGLAMARKSTLENRLVAVLSAHRNRRRVSAALAAIALAVAVGTAVPIAMLCAADASAQPPASQEGKELPAPKDSQKSEASPQPEGSEEPKSGVRLEPDTEEKLQWGEPVNGLRMALVRPQALGEPAAGEVFDFRLVVQNVSEAAVRLHTASAAPKSPYLKLREHGTILAAFCDNEPPQGDFMLQPRETAVLRLFAGRTEGSSMAAESTDLAFVAELKIEKAPPGAWTGTLVTGETSGTFVGYGLAPKDKDARALFNVWSAGARGDGKVPGALIGLLAESVKTFTKNNPTWETTPQLLKMLPRFDATRDWSVQEALALLDALAAVQGTPIRMFLDDEFKRTVRAGAPLPPELANAPWGEALANGLRMAWLLEPRAAEYRLGTPLKSRILIHNAGNGTVVFRTRTWHQGGHEASDAKGAAVKVESTYWTTIGRLVPFRLAPGEFIEVNAAGIGVGAMHDSEDWQNTRVGSWVEAKEGDEVIFTAGPVPLNDWTEKPPREGAPRWWLDFIAARLARELPLPADAAERTRLLYRVAIDLFGTPLGAEESGAFLADREPNALDLLATRLANRPGITPYSGALQSGATRFRVLPADPDAARRPRVAANPGRYTLNQRAVLVVIRRPDGERLVNEATIQFSSSGPAELAPGAPYRLELPDGYATWAAAWIRGETVLWLQDKSRLRRIDFADPVQVKETIVQATQLQEAPTPILDALRAELTVPQAPQAPKPPAATAR